MDERSPRSGFNCGGSGMEKLLFLFMSTSCPWVAFLFVIGVSDGLGDGPPGKNPFCFAALITGLAVDVSVDVLLGGTSFASDFLTFFRLFPLSESESSPERLSSSESSLSSFLALEPAFDTLDFVVPLTVFVPLSFDFLTLADDTDFFDVLAAGFLPLVPVACWTRLLFLRSLDRSSEASVDVLWSLESDIRRLELVVPLFDTLLEGKSFFDTFADSLPCFPDASLPDPLTGAAPAAEWPPVFECFDTSAAADDDSFNVFAKDGDDFIIELVTELLDIVVVLVTLPFRFLDSDSFASVDFDLSAASESLDDFPPPAVSLDWLLSAFVPLLSAAAAAATLLLSNFLAAASLLGSMYDDKLNCDIPVLLVLLLWDGIRSNAVGSVDADDGNDFIVAFVPLLCPPPLFGLLPPMVLLSLFPSPLFFDVPLLETVPPIRSDRSLGCRSLELDELLDEELLAVRFSKEFDRSKDRSWCWPLSL